MHSWIQTIILLLKHYEANIKVIKISKAIIDFLEIISGIM